MSIKVIHEPEPKPGILKKPELYALSIGQVIGAGVITLIVPAIKMTGYSSWLAYLTAIIMGFIMVAPTIFVSSTLRMAGGNYSMLCELAGPTYSGIFAFVYLTQCLSLSLFGTSAAAYLGDIFPVLGGPVTRIIVGLSLLTFFYVVNLMGVDIMAKAQKIMTWLLIAALMIFAVIGLLQRHLPIFDIGDPAFLTNGWGITFDKGQISGGFFGAVLLFVYSCNGYSMTSAYGAEAKNAKRDIPWAMIMSVPTLILLYVGVAMAATGCMSLQEYGESTTLVFAAQKMFPTWLFFGFIIGGPIMALLSTLNSSFAYNAITIGQSCDDGWLPVSFGKRNSRGSRAQILTFMYILGVLPIVFGLSITVITNMVQLITAVLGLLYMIAYFKLPNKYPKAWSKARLHIPNWLYYLICIFSLIFYGIVFWKSTLSMNPVLAVGAVVTMIILTIVAVIRAKKGNITIHTSVWSGEKDEDGYVEETEKTEVSQTSQV